MDNAMYVGLSRQQALEHQLDVIANNVANVDTAGFKVESLIIETDPVALPANGNTAGSTVNFALDAGITRDFGQGALKEGGGPFALAIQGAGFFQVSTPQGTRYTRDGRFTLDSQGRMVTMSGQPLQGDGGDITVDPAKGEIKVAQDGTVSQGGQTIGKIGLVTFSSLTALSKAGDGLYSNVSNLQPQPVTNSRVLQNMTEASNVEPITQITKLIEVSRAYERVSQMLQTTGALSTNSIDTLGRLNAA